MLVIQWVKRAGLVLFICQPQGQGSSGSKFSTQCKCTLFESGVKEDLLGKEQTHT